MKLDAIPPPEGAEERAWQIVRAAFDERAPSPPERKVWRPVVVLAAVAVVAAAVASPPGQAVLDSIREAVGVDRAQPALFSLPASGPAARGVGGRRLGRPGRRLEAAAGRLAGGIVVSVRTLLSWWRGRTSWRRSNRTATFAGRSRVRTFASHAGPAASDRHADRVSQRQLSAGRRRGRDGGSPAAAERGSRGAGMATRAKASGSRTPTGRVARSSSTRILAASCRASAASGSRGDDPDGGAPPSEVVTGGRVVFRGTGEFRDVARSPDGRWLLVTWPTADQWVFVRTAGAAEGSRRCRASRASSEAAAFPRIAGWCCA